MKNTFYIHAILFYIDAVLPALGKNQDGICNFISDGDLARLTATDNTLFIEAEAELITITEPFKFAVNLREFKRVIKCFEDEIDIEVFSDHIKLSNFCSKDVQTIPITKPRDYKFKKSDDTIYFRQEILKKELKKMMFTLSVAKNDITTSGILFEVENEILKLTTSGADRYAVSTVKLLSGKIDPVVIPLRTLKETCKNIRWDEGWMNVAGKIVSFCGEELVIVRSNYLEVEVDRKPEYKELKHDCYVKVSSGELKKLVEEIIPLTSKPNYEVTITIDSKGLGLKPGKAGEKEHLLSGKGDSIGSALILLNCKYFYEAICACTEKEITISCQVEDDHIFISDTDNYYSALRGNRLYQ